MSSNIKKKGRFTMDKMTKQRKTAKAAIVFASDNNSVFSNRCNLFDLGISRGSIN